MSTPKIYPVGCNASMTCWLDGTIVNCIHKADLVVFPGGADINPYIYGEEKHKETSCIPAMDIADLDDMKTCVALGKKMLGICRGAQLLCAKAGGKLVQHQENNHSHHGLMTFDGHRLVTTSAHHQAMWPWNLAPDKYAILGWTTGLSKFHEDAKGREMVIDKVPLSMEVELAFFPGIKGLGIQGHPEWQYHSRIHNKNDMDFIVYLKTLVKRFMDGDQFKDANNAFASRV